MCPRPGARIVAATNGAFLQRSAYDLIRDGGLVRRPALVEGRAGGYLMSREHEWSSPTVLESRVCMGDVGAVGARLEQLLSGPGLVSATGVDFRVLACCETIWRDPSTRRASLLCPQRAICGNGRRSGATWRARHADGPPPPEGSVGAVRRLLLPANA
jgi:hypothetical protein